jgi:diguanylate cyclase (GGDEF)-like protein
MGWSVRAQWFAPLKLTGEGVDIPMAMQGSVNKLSAMPMIPPMNEAEGEALPSIQSHTPQSNDELTLRCVLETAERSKTGILTYPAVWLALTLVAGAGARWPLLMWGNLAGLSALALLRQVLSYKLPDLLHSHRVGAEWAFNCLTLSAALYWGVLAGLLVAQAPGESVSWIMLVATIAFCTGGNTLFAINPRLRYPYPFFMITPVIVAQFLAPSPENWMMLVSELALAFYLKRASGLVHKDYWDGRHSQRLSEQQAQKLEMASLTDNLTQVPNRAYFDRQYAYEWTRQCRHGGPVSVMMIDLDHFKQVNDSYGHPFGDDCLRAVATALQEGCGRSTDFVARYGGEEFVVLLAETDSDGARIVADRMLQLVRGLTLECKGNHVPLTCSIGLTTTVPYHTKPRMRLVEDADRALYRAKAAGRDQVFITDTSSEIPPLSRKT